MKLFTRNAPVAFPQAFTTRLYLHFAALLLATGISLSGFAQQAVSGVITDYNGYWNSSVGNINAIKPSNSHNLLAFTYNSKTYSTGINDALLGSSNVSFTPGDFWALPVEGFSGTVTSNTKVGVGEMYDGVHNGAGNVPVNNISRYLTDGIKGLDIGTCIANIPVGTLTFVISNIKPENIGDGIPDILVTQVADPSNSYDKYAFTDLSGNIIGVAKDVVFNDITPVANWTADFYEASTNPMALTAGFTNTDRPMRLWAADVSDFGINLSNYQQISRFRINLSGNSDVAFAAYNNKTFTFASVLPVKLVSFTGREVNGKAQLNWQTETETKSSHFLVEKSTDNQQFVVVDSVRAAGNSSQTKNYSATDRLQAGVTYYRLRMVDQDGRIEYSNVIRIQYKSQLMTVSAYPNPATDKIIVTYPASGKTLQVFNTAGIVQQQIALNQNSSQSTIDLARFTKGVYYLVWQGETEKISHSFIVR